MIINQISKLVDNYLIYYYNTNKDEKALAIIIKSLHLLLNGNYEKYQILDIEEIINSTSKIESSEIQSNLSNVNEKELNRKEYGVYYTPAELTRYITENSFLNYVNENTDILYNDSDFWKAIIESNREKVLDLLFDAVILDPTCGASEFLLTAFDNKVKILKEIYGLVLPTDIIKIISTIKGNDTNITSTEISKVRLFISAIEYVTPNLYERLVEILNVNFTNYDYVLMQEYISCDIILGNPPYVEYGKLSYTPQNKFGNIYADVVKNSIDSLSNNGVFGLVIPLSYIATNRMKHIRKYVSEKCDKEFIISFADRPACLFPGVHQKLCVLIARKGKGKHKVYTSRYMHFTKSEKETIFDNIEVVPNRYTREDFIPKIGNKTEEQIYSKILNFKGNNIFELSEQKSEDKKELYLNMRGCFFIKVFTFNPGSKEYKSFSFNEDMYYFILCLLNSSLYFVFWSIVSDCWHITRKELELFNIPEKIENKGIFRDLAEELETKLEETKVYIGSKQVDYEYKHKNCMEVIDKIDTELSKVYDLSTEELEYIKEYDRKYRLGL